MVVSCSGLRMELVMVSWLGVVFMMGLIRV